MAAQGVSVVVCTRDRPEDLRECLAALARVEHPAFEVVVVDNASRDASTRALVVAAGRRYVREERAGLDWARNRGLREARHEIVAFVDDDARPEPGWLRGFERAFADPATLAATGLVVPAELGTPAQRLYERARGMGRGTVPRRFEWHAMSARQRIATHEIGVGANMAFRRTAFALAGEFDTVLDVGTPSRGAGDLDMLFRVLRAGGVVRYEPGAVVRHRHRRGFDELACQLADNGCSFGVYLAKRMRERGAALGAIAYAAGVWWPWLLSRVVRSAVGWHAFPLALTWAELRGALESPRAYRRTYARDRELRRASVDAGDRAARPRERAAEGTHDVGAR